MYPKVCKTMSTSSSTPLLCRDFLLCNSISTNCNHGRDFFLPELIILPCFEVYVCVCMLTREQVAGLDALGKLVLRRLGKEVRRRVSPGNEKTSVMKSFKKATTSVKIR